MAEKLTGPEINSLLHWSEYGQMGEASNHRVLASEWKTKPFRQPIHSSWNHFIPSDQLDRLLNGFCPVEMEDKWFVYADGPNAQGHATLHMFRSWTGHKMAEIKIEVAAMEDNCSAGERRARMTGITWESSEDAIRGNSEGRAKQSAKEVCRWVLGMKLPENEEIVKAEGGQKEGMSDVN